MLLWVSKKLGEVSQADLSRYSLIFWSSKFKALADRETQKCHHVCFHNPFKRKIWCWSKLKILLSICAECFLLLGALASSNKNCGTPCLLSELISFSTSLHLSSSTFVSEMFYFPSALICLSQKDAQTTFLIFRGAPCQKIRCQTKSQHLFIKNWTTQANDDLAAGDKCLIDVCKDDWTHRSKPIND